MKRIFFLILFFSNSVLYSQFDDYEVLYASQFENPFELRQVFLNEPDICGQIEHTQFAFYYKNLRETEKIDVAVITLNTRRDFDEFYRIMRNYNEIKSFQRSDRNDYLGNSLQRTPRYRVAGKLYTMYIDEGHPNFLSIMTNKDFKLTRIHRSKISEFIRDMEYASDYWDNDKCEGGLLIDD